MRRNGGLNGILVDVDIPIPGGDGRRFGFTLTNFQFWSISAHVSLFTYMNGVVGGAYFFCMKYWSIKKMLREGYPMDKYYMAGVVSSVLLFLMSFLFMFIYI